MLPSGLYFQTYRAERQLQQTWPQRAWLLAFLLLLMVLPWLVSSTVLGIVTVAGIALVAVLGLQITIGMAGLLNIGQSAFVGVGAFVAGALASRGHGPWVCIPAAALSSATVSILFGLPAVRIKGLYLALTTLAAQITFPIVVVRLPASWFGGMAGLPVDAPVVFGVSLGTPQRIYGLVCVVAVVAFVAALNLDRSRTGRAFRAMRDNDIASSVMGVNLAHYKIVAFFAGALFAGASGALHGYYVRYVTTEQFTLWLSVWYVGMLIVGGTRSPLGALLGVAAITTLQEGIRELGGWIVQNFAGVSGGFVFPLTDVVLGGVIVLILLFEPLGLAHRWSLVKAAYRIWPYPRQ